MDERKNRALLVAKGNKLVKDLGVVEGAMKKGRANYVDLRKTQDKSAQALERAKQAGDPKKEGGAQKAYEKDENKAEKADNEYRITVNNYKAAQDTYYDIDLPSLLKEFEAYEKRRSETTRNFFEQFVTLQEVIGPHTKDATERLRKQISAINAKSDLDLFVMQQEAKNVPVPTRAVYVSYDGNEGTSSPVTSSAPRPASSSTSSTATSSSAGGDEKKKKGLLGGFLGKRSSDKPPEEKKEPKNEPTTPKGGASGGGDNKVSFTSSAPKSKTVEAPAGSTPSTNLTLSSNAASVSVTVKKEESKKDEPKKDEASPASAPSAGSQEVVALYDYEATEEGELTFAEGEKLTLLEQDDSGWWKGKNVKGVVGVFPSNFVEIVGANGTASAAGGGTGGGSGGNAIEINADYRALYDYDAEDDTELTIKEGDILHVISETDGWYYGTRKTDGKQGNFPSNFVEPV